MEEKGIKVLSLFDGMACGMIAFQKAGIPVKEYTAYEIDKYAIKTATHNFPQIKEMGDVFKADFSQYKGIDYIVGGSPCQHWSIAQSSDKRETTASGIGWELFSQYVRALREVKPKFFIYENNKSMHKNIYKSISETFGFEPICINSALLSAQNRQRLYWVGKRNEDGTYSKVDVEQPEDKGILLKDILDGGIDLTTNDKSYTLTASYDGAVAWNTIERKQRNMVAEPIMFNNSHGYNKGSFTTDKSGTLTSSSWQDNHKMVEPVCMRYERSDKAKELRKDYESGKIKHGFHEFSELQPRVDGKSNTLSTVLKDNPICEPVACRCRGRKDSDGNGYAKYECRDDGKYNTVDTNSGAAMVAEPVGIGERSRESTALDRQHYEARTDGKTNCLSTVQKDCLVAEPIRVGTYPTSDGRLLDSQGTKVYSIEGKSVTQSAQGGGMGAKTGLYAIPIEFEKNIPTKAISCADGKEYPVYEVKNENITIKDKTYPIKLQDGYYIIRKLTVSECKRLQTVPEWYEFPVSNSQSYKLLGNGWTCDVITHLIKSTQKEK